MLSLVYIFYASYCVTVCSELLLGLYLEHFCAVPPLLSYMKIAHFVFCLDFVYVFRFFILNVVVLIVM